MDRGLIVSTQLQSIINIMSNVIEKVFFEEKYDPLYSKNRKCLNLQNLQILVLTEYNVQFVFINSLKA